MNILDAQGRPLRREAGFDKRERYVADESVKDAVSGTTHRPDTDEGRRLGAHEAWRQEPYMRRKGAR
jgi:hypothetical protein